MQVNPSYFSTNMWNPNNNGVVYAGKGISVDKIKEVYKGFVVIVESDVDIEGVFCVEESALNQVKPSVYVCDTPSEFELRLCKHFGTEVIDSEKLNAPKQVVNTPVAASKLPELRFPIVVNKATSPFLKKDTNNASNSTEQ